MRARVKPPRELGAIRRRRAHSCWGHLIAAPLWPMHGANLGTLLRTCDAVGACLAVPPFDWVDGALARGNTLRRRTCVHRVANPLRWLEKERTEGAVVLHDVAKPYCTQHSPEGRITAHGHSRRGELMARRILWEAGVPAGRREHIAALIRHHQLPFWALERTDLERVVLRVSLLASNEDLALLATADILGRSCDDQAQVLENIELFRGYCRELGVYEKAWDFASDHSRFMYFRTPGRDPRYAAYDDTRCTVTVMSGFPGTGKDTWIAANRPDSPVVSLDALRTKLNISPGGDQRPVAAAAYELAREHLRARRDFVWNATNISRQQRDMCVGLAAAYHARVEIVALEASPEVIRARNSGRGARVPEQVVERLKDRWEAPDLTEAHRVERVDTERFVD